MKRVLSIGLAVMLLLSMSACTGGSSNLPATLHISEPTSVSSEEFITVPTTKPTATTTKAATTATTLPVKTQTTDATTKPTIVATKTTTASPTIKPTTVATKTTVEAPTTAPTTAATLKCEHSKTVWVIDEEATCIAEGKKHKACTNCEAVLENTVVEKTAHSYINYKCTVCGVFQEKGLSAYLSDWVQKNGKVNGETISVDFYIDDILCGFTYNASGNYLYFSLLDENYNDFLSMKFTETAGIYDLAYIQGTEPNTREVYGKINASHFTENTPITVEEYIGNSDGRLGAVENCRICSCLLLDAIETAFNNYEVGLTLSDLGFSELK